MDGQFAVSLVGAGLTLEVPTAEQIKALESAMLALPQLPIEIVHDFADGTYSRTMIAAANTLIVGKTHRSSCVNIISEGSIIVWTKDEVKRIEAPCVFVSPGGTKRVGLTLEKTIWTTVHPNPANTKNLELIEAAIIERETINPPPRNPELAPGLQDLATET